MSALLNFLVLVATRGYSGINVTVKLILGLLVLNLNYNLDNERTIKLSRPITIPKVWNYIGVIVKNSVQLNS